ncbi:MULTISPECIES: acyl-CoA dehydrogenase family protein [Bradyrhizobium]|uniref:acyl-CoA dehydrogenase family protein n=1 Tax=Bradyrhizobium centrosematis TaxID=1300039 RepID=UPI0021694D25|nr:acyl-CoA dehydrogenase [Bradyrhizobium centrosematis]MCS3765915.1 alkylation response protein AidB-like acyl-CoA dehydrogenase [Bradyrhizobium centrosematis]MCS3778249.1 alkylation response protein AidB-like acyl-CoA dehydrogenase [Bradyrhizobium centrosematis]
MPLFHTEDQTMLADTVRHFLAKEAPVRHMRALRDADDRTGFSRELWKRFAELGLNGVLIEEADGGLGLGHVEAGIVLGEIGRNLTPSPFLATAVGAVMTLRGGSAAQRQAWLPRILTGEAVGALAIDEGVRHRPDRIGLQAERIGKGFRLMGEKRFVTCGHAADFLIVPARTAGSDGEELGLTLFLIERNTADLRIETERLTDSSLVARLRFDGVEAFADAVIGELDNGFGGLKQTLSALRAGTSAEMMGVGSGAFAMTLDYLKQRKQFGRLIGSFQALQHRAAHVHTEMEVARASILKAQQLLDCDDTGAEQAVMVAKAMTGMASALAVKEGIQMHGGIGMTDEYDIGFYMKRQRVLAELFGDVDYHSNRLAQLAGY